MKGILTGILLTIFMNGNLLGQSILGDWKGKGNGKYVEGSFDIVFKIRNNENNGSFKYPRWNCEGTIKKTTVQGGWTIYKESLSKGNCMNNGTVKLKKSGSKMHYEYYNSYKGGPREKIAWSSELEPKGGQKQPPKKNNKGKKQNKKKQKPKSKKQKPKSKKSEKDQNKDSKKNRKSKKTKPGKKKQTKRGNKTQGAACSRDSECKSGHCDKNACLAGPDLSQGWSCKYDDQCKSRKCDKKQCMKPCDKTNHFRNSSGRCKEGGCEDGYVYYMRKCEEEWSRKQYSDYRKNCSDGVVRICKVGINKKKARCVKTGTMSCSSGKCNAGRTGCSGGGGGGGGGRSRSNDPCGPGKTWSTACNCCTSGGGGYYID